jgi:hypothetical protein
MTLEPLDPTGRWWRINGREIDLNSTEFVGHDRAAVLAHRDATDDDGHNVAALLEAIIDGDLEPGTDRTTFLIAGWLFAQSQRIVARLRAQIDHPNGAPSERAA